MSTSGRSPTALGDVPEHHHQAGDRDVLYKQAAIRGAGYAVMHMHTAIARFLAPGQRYARV